MIDTHAHLTDAEYAENLDSMIKNFKQDDLKYVFTVGFDYESSKKCVELANNYNNVYAVIGVHPDEINSLSTECIEFLKRSANNAKVIAIGEIGLDYHFNKENKEQQKQAFVTQLQLADQCGLPIVIHSRDAVADTLDVLKQNRNLLNNGGVIHCFNESIESFNEYKKLGFIVGLGGVITFKNAKNAISLIEHIGFDDFVIETDCPYLTPEPLRGKYKNQPKYVKYVLEKIAEIKNVSTNKINECSTINALRLFKKVKG